MNLGQAWRTLGISRTAQTSAIRSAYAARLKGMEVDQDVDGYARLRQARDMALAWANQQAARPADPLPPEPPPEAPDGLEPQPEADVPPWPYAAPAIEMAGRAAVTIRPGEAAGIYDAWPVAGLVRRDAGGGGLDLGQPLVAPLFSRPGAAHPVDLVQPDGQRADALYDLLLGDGVPEDEPLDAQEEALARRHLEAVLREAAASDLRQQANIEQWLAGVLARAWPRSAPLLEPAAAAFDWEREVGNLGERPAVGFLVARLRGLRFHGRVLEPGHQFHKAWMELSRPGPAGVLKRLRVSGDDVRQLLEGIRKHFPELESHLDPERIYSWESPSLGSGSGRIGWGAWWIGGIIVLQILGAIARAAGSGEDDAGAPRSEIASYFEDEAADDRLLDEVAADIFGSDMTWPRLAAADPELAATIRSNLNIARRSGNGDEAFRQVAANLVRGRVYEVAQSAGGPDLDAAIRLRLGYLKALEALGPGTCMTLYRTGSLDPRVSLPPQLHVQEQQLAAALLRQGRLKLPKPRGGGTVRIPGILVERVRTSTGLPKERIARSLMNEGSDADRCAVTIALAAAALDWRGGDREPILQTI